MEEKREEVITKKEFSKHCMNNDQAFTEIKKMLEPLVELYPSLKESVELKKATDKVLNTWKGWTKLATIFLVFIATILVIILYTKQILVDWILK